MAYPADIPVRARKNGATNGMARGAAPLLGALVVESGAMTAAVVVVVLGGAVEVVVSTAWTETAARATITAAKRMVERACMAGSCMEAARITGINTSGPCAV